ncbi:hypothetical protein AB6805_18515 [Chitinophaga sp. RCC_12]|uniref:hypothetical protein n=1 Tax=Chitinophaga sp. RCC_12 TaxID=3239226 RepID=UPI00352553E7
MDTGVRIVDLNILDYHAADPENLKKAATYHGKITLEAGVNISAREKQVTIALKATLFIQNESKDLINAGYIISQTVFDLLMWDKFVKKDGSKYAIDKRLDSFLIGVSYDSLRGLLRERGKNHIVGKIILPVVDPADITRVNVARKAGKTKNKA